MISTTNNEVAALEQIAAALAHEVKNPLTLAKARLDLLESSDERIDNKKSYNLIRKELNKINDIMLDFINIMQTPDEENFDFVYLSDIIYSLAERYKEIYESRINFTVDVENTEVVILGNEKNIQILFNNIIKNALEAIEKDGQIFLSVRTNQANGSIIATVRDTGKGIPKDLENKIHENYFTTKKFGSGLGLSICKKIAQDHKGKFEISNNDDLGCIAKVVFPTYSSV